MIEQSSPKTQFYQTSQFPRFLTIHIPNHTKPFKTPPFIKINLLYHNTPTLPHSPSHFITLSSNLNYITLMIKITIKPTIS